MLIDLETPTSDTGHQPVLRVEDDAGSIFFELLSRRPCQSRVVTVPVARKIVKAFQAAIKTATK